jgi:caffeoyl-CoA O-methyltransferase
MSQAPVLNQSLFEAVDQYISHLLAPSDEALLATGQSIIDSGIPQISVSPNQGKFLQVLAQLSRAEKILELGTLAGYSTIWMARALPSHGRLISLEVDPLHASVARKNIDRAGLSGKVEIQVGKAIDLLAELHTSGAGPFDMIFIDADKPPYAEYFQWALRLSRPGTLIVADNVIREGRVLDPSDDDERVRGIQRFNALLARTKEVSATILQTVGAKEYDGMAVIVVR